MHILVINSGSSSVKFLIVQIPEEKILLRGNAEKAGSGNLKYSQERSDGQRLELESPEYNYHKAFDFIFKYMTDKEYGILDSVSDLAAAGHRLVHGGEGISGAVEITARLLLEMREKTALAPLHYPANLAGIEYVSEKLPGVFQAGVFDTAFHQTMPFKSFIYGIPMKYYEKYGIRRYGFHGSSHQYVALKACELLQRNIEGTRIITCHLGNGASLAALKGGRSMDTSMGFTPLEGLIMGNRSGDIDPGILLYLMKEKNLKPDEIEKILNNESGILGLSGISGDIREVLEAAGKGNKQAKLAIETYVYRVKKYIGAYSAALGGLDILVFTGGVGENSDYIRSEACKDMEFLGIHLDEEKNRMANDSDAIISAGSQGVSILMIKTNEELIIANETAKLLQKKRLPNAR